MVTPLLIEFTNSECYAAYFIVLYR